MADDTTTPIKGARGVQGDAQVFAFPGSIPESDLSDRQRDILEMIRNTILERGYPPTVREIGETVGLASPSSVAYQLKVLTERGYLRRDLNRARAVEVMSPDSHAESRPLDGDEELARGDSMPVPAYIPVIGRVAAGGPILAEERVETVFPLPRELVGEGTLFMLTVVGESMIEAAICDGDWVVVRQQNNADNGDIVAAMIDGEATVKTYKRGRDGRVWLMPHNPAFSPIAGDEAVIMGKVVSVLRRI